MFILSSLVSNQPFITFNFLSSFLSKLALIKSSLLWSLLSKLAHREFGFLSNVLLKLALITSSLLSINQSIFYFMSVHIEVILDKNKKHIIIIYTNFPTGL